MATVQPITTLNIDGNALNVSDLSDKVQALVNVYNDWNQDFASAQSRFAQLQAALNDLSRQIILQVKQDQDAAAAAANDASITPDASSGNGAAPVDTSTAKE